jgi:spore germination protein YaaH
MLPAARLADEPAGLHLGADNGIEGSLPTLPQMQGAESYRVLPTARNWTEDGVVRSDLVDNLLAVPESQAAHVQAITDLVVREMYSGIDLDYRGINPDLRGEYSAFVTSLAAALHANGKELTVHVEAPAQIAEDRWETGAYDWASLGQAVDGLKFPALQDPVSYAPGGQMENLLWWATGEVDRSKLRPQISTRSIERAGDMLVERTYRDALAELTKLAQAAGGNVVVPGQQVTISLDTPGIQYDASTGQYWFTYVDEASGEQRTIWLEDASSLSRKLDLWDA